MNSRSGSTFSESAVAENVRLLALSADVGRALTEGAPLRESLQNCSEALVRHLDAAFARVWTLNEAGNTLELQASAGLYTHLDGPHGRVPVGQFKIGLIAQERKPHLTNEVVGDPRVGDQQWAKREGMVAFAGHPLIVADKLVGVMALFARHYLPEVTLDALAAIANQIAVGIQRQQGDLQLQEQTEALTTILRIGQVLSAELDLPRLVQATTDAATDVTGAQFGAFFYNVKNEYGESYTLYAISGVPRERFSQFPMPRNTEIFAPTFTGKSTLRLDNVLQDARYGKMAPHYGMPAGHLPVVSYLAVPVISRSGEVIGSLLFGHEEAGVFTLRHERIVEGLAAQTAIAIDNARLFLAERERTEELGRAIQEVHHRVKNSLQGVSALLEMQLPLDEETMPVSTVREGLNQIKTIALVHDLLARDQPMGKVDVGKVLTNLAELLGPTLQMAERTAAISVEVEQVWIPTKAATALALVVNELISNAAKHSQRRNHENANSSDAIEICLTMQAGRVQVSVQDSGPGFPSGFDPVLHAHIGLELVLTLVHHDLHGRITFSNHTKPEDGALRGGRVEIDFAEDLPA